MENKKKDPLITSGYVTYYLYFISIQRLSFTSKDEFFLNRKSELRKLPIHTFQLEFVATIQNVDVCISKSSLSLFLVLSLKVY